LRTRVHVSPLVEFTFLQEAFVNEVVEIRIEPTVVDLLFV